MRIQHNIMAMNAYRNYSAVRGSLGKNLEKLSSGYKINRAGDDAAGLAISEKMRAQITGLTAAQKNVKDGISLVKTAEGAMQEIQDMLNRMDYLATQSANGTYQDEIDRENLQKEVVNLKREIDRIAESANFNGIKLLDGSLKREISAVAAARSLSGGTASAAGSAVENNAYDSLSLLRLSRTVRAGGSGGTPAKKAVLEFDFDSIAGTYKRGDSIKVTIGDGNKTDTILFWPSADTGVGDAPIGAKSGADLAHYIYERFKDQDYTIDGQAFTLARSGSVLTLEQKYAPGDESQLVKEVNATFKVEVSKAKSSAIVGDPKEKAAFGDKANVQKATNMTNIMDDVTKEHLAEIDVSGFDEKAAVDYMRIKGYKGNTDAILNRWDSFGLHYDPLSKQFSIRLSETIIGFDPITSTVTYATIGDPIHPEITGTADPTGAILIKAGETATLDFGEMGKVKIKAIKDLSPSHFAGKPRGSLSVIENAASANGGSIKFEISDEQRRKLADYADSLAVSSPDSSDNSKPADVTMRWNNTRSCFELISNGHDGSEVVIAESKTRAVTEKGPIEFFINTNDPTTLVVTATMTKTTPDAIGAGAFADGVATGLQFKEPDYNNKTKTNYTAQFTPGALEVLPDKPDPPDPPGPDKPDPPDPPGPGPNPPGPGPGPDDPNPPGPDDPDNPGKPDKPDKPGKSGGLILQIGDTSEEYDRMHVFIGDMHTNAMGAFDKDGNLTAKISDVDIGTQSGAQDAIAVIKGAINYVSSVRGDLGAYQNRLEHTGNNLSVSVENIQDAESTIRDTDMAEEIMGYVKHNLFLQYSQAMLAQANVLPEGVLQLLG